MKRPDAADIRRGLGEARILARHVSGGAAGIASHASQAVTRSASSARDEAALLRQAFREISAEYPELAGAARQQAVKLGIGVAGLASLVVAPARGASRALAFKRLRGAAFPLTLQIASSDIPRFVTMVRRRAQSNRRASYAGSSLRSSERRYRSTDST